MQHTWREVVELGRGLPFEERAAAARELLRLREDELANLPPGLTEDEERSLRAGEKVVRW